MATSATPNGAEPVGTCSSSGSFTGKVVHIKIATTYGTAIFYGDFVKLVAAGTIEKDTGTSSLTSIGIFLGCKYTDSSTSQLTFNQTWPASMAATDAAGYVLIDPDVLFKMQGDATIAQTALGANFAVIQTAGSTTIGRSKNACDADTVATTNTLPIRIVDFYDGPSSSVGDTYTDGIFRFNAGHQLTNTTGI
tara:strand:- start:214 stop:792 length:579 start_codon:yes stop_codon:yes gene_type:complete